ncbi:MAG: GerMN domain-containing protein [Candidatus Schekmanbacteria bacterium]|nr:GerMN domain-containing protein [Candidatus Schekmanbacteria bacterium]
MLSDRTKVGLIAGTLVLLLLGGAGWAVWKYFFKGEIKPSAYDVVADTPESREKIQAELFFATGNGELTVEIRAVNKQPVLELQAKQVIDELVLGPRQRSLQATIPSKSVLRELYLDDQGCAYLNFNIEFKKNHPGSAYAEMLTLASLINTLNKNFPNIDKVQILINGAEIETIAGHIDARYPLAKENVPLSPIGE